MLYTLLIYQAEEFIDNFTAAERAAALAAHRGLQERTKATGAFVIANQLTPSSVATTVRTRNGDTTVLDGPFTETKEQLVGLYVFECDNLDQAIALAKEIPHCATGSIEIRPIAHYEARPPA